ncbi:DUF5343 domain-containing protein [uncultured Parasphingorhabdus sp.]|uniref:DUF5343 domain-containing protein n=1 Tax=uncultured Parasphingorhabdus sp. TaxID=2709694 RepID=UPI002AA9134C|nr:DUF5343 domain-containing protein [uncultured Parasphingorhabdus sp.]
MVDDSSTDGDDRSEKLKPKKGKQSTPRRQIPGNLPYLASYGTLKGILDKIIELAKPDKFNYDFLENVVKRTGGAARACIPILKKMEFLNSDGTTTELYARFRTEGGRSFATYQGLKNAFPEIFKRSDYAYNIEEQKIRDIIVEITGLKSTDNVVKAIKGTFLTIRSFVDPDFNHALTGQVASSDDKVEAVGIEAQPMQQEQKLGIAYNINIVVPETSDLNVLNAIFRSVRENLLK